MLKDLNLSQHHERVVRRVSTGRVSLGRLYGPATSDDLLGRVLYLPDDKMLATPLNRLGAEYSCEILTRLDTITASTMMNFGTRAIDSAWRSVDPINTEYFLVAWLAHAARALWSQRPLWHMVRTVVILACEQSTTDFKHDLKLEQEDLILNADLTLRVCRAATSIPRALTVLLNQLETNHSLVRRTADATNKWELGSVRLTLPDYPLNSPVEPAEREDVT